MRDLPNEILHEIQLYLSFHEVIICHRASPAFWVMTDAEMYKGAINDPHLPDNYAMYTLFLPSYPNTLNRLFAHFARETVRIREELTSVIEGNSERLKREESNWGRDDMFVPYHYQLSNTNEDVLARLGNNYNYHYRHKV